MLKGQSNETALLLRELLAEDGSIGRDSHRVPQRGVQCSDIAQKVLALHERLGQRYQDAATPAIEEQLAKAGVRLGMVLNRLWP